MSPVLHRLFAGDTVHRIIRTFVITFAGLFLPGLLGWLNDVTAWAGSSGQRPFPDAHNLSYLLVAAAGAGLVTVVNAIWLMVENASGKGLLRNPAPTETVPAPEAPPERGAIDVQPWWGAFLIAAGLTAYLVFELLRPVLRF